VTAGQPRKDTAPWDIEAGAVEAGRAQDVRVTRLCDEAIAMLDESFALWHVALDQPADLVARLALVIASTSLRSAWLLAFSGYEAQAMTVARPVLEYVQLATYVQEVPDEAGAWLSVQPPPKQGAQLRRALERLQERPALTVEDMVQRSIVQQAMPRVRSHLRSLAAGLSAFSHAGAISHSTRFRLGDPIDAFPPGGRIDKLGIRRAALALVSLGVQVLAAFPEAVSAAPARAESFTRYLEVAGRWHGEVRLPGVPTDA
jgi:hypothetical protein